METLFAVWIELNWTGRRSLQWEGTASKFTRARSGARNRAPTRKHLLLACRPQQRQRQPPLNCLSESAEKRSLPLKCWLASADSSTAVVRNRWMDRWTNEWMNEWMKRMSRIIVAFEFCLVSTFQKWSSSKNVAAMIMIHRRNFERTSDEQATLNEAQRKIFNQRFTYTLLTFTFSSPNLSRSPSGITCFTSLKFTRRNQPTFAVKIHELGPISVHSRLFFVYLDRYFSVSQTNILTGSSSCQRYSSPSWSPSFHSKKSTNEYLGLALLCFATDNNDFSAH